ncbi:GNAT family N-acetyltransferase [Pelagibacterium sp. H642]|uniref:GNAT family N-acetyltransferase n=1 Tax=Pelagibacterium sp. H642 TaxID=1881069 RepID=UPI002814DC61|nr:GNAT family N-acetyltransferase [Pelagibacterium sp. H642]WMT89878.1 GNAT family N-acetyltransferase [Pelagibacterium sp. H642]
MKNIDVTIRAYQAADLEALSAIWFEASMLAHPFIGEARLREQRVLIETVYLPKAENWVACTDDRPAGFISLLDNFIGGLFVSPNRQGLGIGRALVAHAKALKGELELEVYLDNPQACAFYHALGFEEVSRRTHDDQGLPFGNAHLILRA